MGLPGADVSGVDTFVQTRKQLSEFAYEDLYIMWPTGQVLSMMLIVAIPGIGLSCWSDF